MKKLYVILMLVALLALFTAPTLATEGGTFKATLTGYGEVPALSSPGSGEFRAKLTSDGTAIEYTLTYSGLQNVFAAHIHLGQAGVIGGVSAFLCGGGDKPLCDPSADTVKGTIDPADVIGPTGQGIALGEFDELVAAMVAGATYANVHTNPGFPGGEIRGQIN